jgi:arylsulfatase A-like enzyme
VEDTSHERRLSMGLVVLKNRAMAAGFVLFRPVPPLGMPDEAPTIATVLKSMGYATAQFGKNHLGDLNQFLPTLPRQNRIGGAEQQGTCQHQS